MSGDWHWEDERLRFSLPDKAERVMGAVLVVFGLLLVLSLASFEDAAYLLLFPFAATVVSTMIMILLMVEPRLCPQYSCRSLRESLFNPIAVFVLTLWGTYCGKIASDRQWRWGDGLLIVLWLLVTIYFGNGIIGSAIRHFDDARGSPFAWPPIVWLTLPLLLLPAVAARVCWRETPTITLVLVIISPMAWSALIEQRWRSPLNAWNLSGHLLCAGSVIALAHMIVSSRERWLRSRGRPP